jgi:hypothetical protein
LFLNRNAWRFLQLLFFLFLWTVNRFFLHLLSNFNMFCYLYHEVIVKEVEEYFTFAKGYSFFS